MTALAINAVLAFALALGLSLASVFLGPARTLEGDKGLPYESGMPPLNAADGRMRILYCRFAVLFVVFDVDLAFLAPWILLRHELTLEKMIVMTVFLAWVALTLAVVWRNGALRCN